MAEFGHREIELSLREDGSRRVFLLRPFSLGDEQGIYDCVTEEYGDSYFKRDFYDVSKIKENALGEHYCFFVAETGGEIAGMEIFHIYRDEEEDYIEPASQIIRKQYRGYGLADALVDYTLPLAESMYPCALFVHAVTFHKATQAICEGYGMIPVGFRLGSFLTERMINSYEKKCIPRGLWFCLLGRKTLAWYFFQEKWQLSERKSIKGWEANMRSWSFRRRNLREGFAKLGKVWPTKPKSSPKSIRFSGWPSLRWYKREKICSAKCVN